MCRALPRIEPKSLDFSQVDPVPLRQKEGLVYPTCNQIQGTYILNVTRLKTCFSHLKIIRS